MIGFVKSKSGLQDALRKGPSNEQAQQWKLPVAGLTGLTSYNSVSGSGDVNLDQAPVNAPLAENYDEGTFSNWALNELASMDPEERRIAGLDHLELRFTQGNGNKAYDRSYPSTTSGRIDDEDEHGPTKTGVFSDTLNRMRAEHFAVTPTQSTQAAAGAIRWGAFMPDLDHERICRNVDLTTPYPLSTVDRPSIPRSVPSTPTAHGKRKAPSDVQLVQALGTQEHPVLDAAFDQTTAHNTSERLVQASESGTNALKSLGNDAIPDHQSDMPGQEFSRSAPDKQFEREQMPIHELVDGQLDYEETELYAMDFANLQDEPFDQDASNESPHVSNDGTSNPLEERLQRMVNKSSQDQQFFFASLNSAEREEAGAWFTERFREVTKKLDSIRADRRELARSFEEEIAGRQLAVAQETHNLDTTLREMKTKGGLVLTPKGK